MTYYADQDPENAVDTNYYADYAAKLMDAMENSEDDRRAIAEMLAFFLTGMKDDFSQRRLVRTLTERATLIVEREE